MSNSMKKARNVAHGLLDDIGEYSLADYCPEEDCGSIDTINPETYWLLMEQYGHLQDGD